MKLIFTGVVILFVVFGTNVVTAKKDCQKKRQDAIQQANSFMMGVYVPQCTSSGEYKTIQCDGSTGYCWCVNENGDQVGYQTRNKKSLNCVFKRNAGRDACEQERKNALHDAQVMTGVYIPSCNSDGTYKPLQCDTSTGYCWCTDIHTGQQIGMDSRDKSQLICGNFS